MDMPKFKFGELLEIWGRTAENFYKNPEREGQKIRENVREPNGYFGSKMFSDGIYIFNYPFAALVAVDPKQNSRPGFRGPNQIGNGQSRIFKVVYYADTKNNIKLILPINFMYIVISYNYSGIAFPCGQVK